MCRIENKFLLEECNVLDGYRDVSLNVLIQVHLSLKLDLSARQHLWRIHLNPFIISHPNSYVPPSLSLSLLLYFGELIVLILVQGCRTQNHWRDSGA